MFTALYESKKIKNLVKSLKEDYNLSNYEALDIALKIEKNEILSRAFVLSDSNSHPTALEKLVHTIEESRQ